MPAGVKNAFAALGSAELKTAFLEMFGQSVAIWNASTVPSQPSVSCAEIPIRRRLRIPDS